MILPHPTRTLPVSLLSALLSTLLLMFCVSVAHAAFDQLELAGLWRGHVVITTAGDSDQVIAQVKLTLDAQGRVLDGKLDYGGWTNPLSAGQLTLTAGGGLSGSLVETLTSAGGADRSYALAAGRMGLDRQLMAGIGEAREDGDVTGWCRLLLSRHDP